MLRNRIIYAIYAILSIVLVSYVGGVIPYALFYLAVLLPLISFIYIFVVYFNLQFYQTTPKRIVVKGDKLSYKVRLINNSLISFSNVKLNFYQEQCEVDKSGKIKAQSLLPGEEIELDSQMICRYRGEYEVGACDIEISDFLYMLHLRYRVAWPLRLMVLPRIVMLEQLSFLPNLVDPKITGFPQKSESETRENELRTYQNGDLKKAIHWKASARQGKLLTRKNEPQVKGENYLFLDLYPTGEENISKLEIEDKMIEVALAVGSYLKEHWINGTMFLNNGHLQSYLLSEEGAFGKFYEDCGTLPFIGEDMSACLEELITFRLLQGNYILVTHRITERLLTLLSDECIRHSQFIILFIEKEEEKLDEQIKQQLLLNEVLLYEIKCSDDLREKLEGSEG